MHEDCFGNWKLQPNSIAKPGPHLLNVLRQRRNKQKDEQGIADDIYAILSCDDKHFSYTSGKTFSIATGVHVRLFKHRRLFEGVAGMRIIDGH